jgi:CHAD domain-containing protein
MGSPGGGAATRAGRPGVRRAAPHRDLGYWLRHLEAHARLARGRDAPEDVHQLRVATRRLRAALELQGREALVGDLRALGRELGPARDLHLAAELAPLAPWAREATARERPLVLAALDTPRTRGLLAALRHLPAAPGPDADRELARRTRAVEKALRQLDRAKPEAWALALHRLRRQVRRLRYAREALGRPARQLADVQEGLGAFCDLLALKGLLERWARDTGAESPGALARLDRALSGPAAPAPPPPPGSPARRPARSPGARRGPSPSAS